MDKLASFYAEDMIFILPGQEDLSREGPTRDVTDNVACGRLDSREPEIGDIRLTEADVLVATVGQRTTPVSPTADF